MHSPRRVLPAPPEALGAVSQLKGADGYGVERVVRCRLLPFVEDRSDWDRARYLEENLAATWFGGHRV